MFFPYQVDVPMKRYPLANWLIIFITVITSFYWWSQMARFDPDPNNWLNYPFSSGNFHLKQLITPVLIHAGIIHLIGNMVFLFVFGNAINAKLGHLQYIALYFGIGVIESLAWAILADGPALGASGAIMGIVGLFLVYYPRNTIQVFYWFFFIFAGSTSIAGIWLILIYFGFDLWGLISEGAGVAYLAHIVGFLTGAGIGITLVKLGITPPDQYEENILEVIAARRV